MDDEKKRPYTATDSMPSVAMKLEHDHATGALKWFLVTLTSPETWNEFFRRGVQESSLDRNDFTKILVEARDVHGNFQNEIWVDDKRIYFSKCLFRVETVDDIESFKKKNVWVTPL